jgi:hypothetical protein
MGDRIKQMMDIQSKALDLFAKKNVDYGDAFASYGIIGVLIRIQDKIQRALSITSNNITLVEDEGMSDTMLDLHNYAAMALMLMEEGKSDNCLETNINAQSIEFLDVGGENDDEYQDYQDYQEYNDGDFNPYISISYPFQVNNAIEYDNECEERDDHICQEV